MGGDIRIRCAPQISFCILLVRGSNFQPFKRTAQCALHLRYAYGGGYVSRSELQGSHNRGMAAHLEVSATTEKTQPRLVDKRGLCDPTPSFELLADMVPPTPASVAGKMANKPIG